MRTVSIPNQRVVEKLVKSVFEHLFPATHSFTDTETERNLAVIKTLLSSILAGLLPGHDELTDSFFHDLGKLKKNLIKDAEFMLESDPAARELMEVIAIYPGFYAIFCYRVANYLARAGVPLLPRMITEQAHRMTGIDIHPLASIGSPFSIDHGTGIVIGETTNIGNSVKIYQGVTLGALSVDKSKASTKRHPTIEDNVILYSGCTILGGSTIVGRSSIIGGNVWLTESVAPFSVVYHKSEIVVRDNGNFKEPLNFII